MRRLCSISPSRQWRASSRPRQNCTEADMLDALALCLDVAILDEAARNDPFAVQPISPRDNNARISPC